MSQGASNLASYRKYCNQWQHEDVPQSTAQCTIDKLTFSKLKSLGRYTCVFIDA